MLFQYVISIACAGIIICVQGLQLLSVLTSTTSIRQHGEIRKPSSLQLLLMKEHFESSIGILGDLIHQDENCLCGCCYRFCRRCCRRSCSIRCMLGRLCDHPRFWSYRSCTIRGLPIAMCSATSYALPLNIANCTLSVSYFGCGLGRPR